MNAHPPDATVIVVTYESEPVLQRCLDALPASRGVASVEAIVVDNASTDGSRELAAASGARVIALDRNVGFAGAVNRGLAVAGGRYRVLVNPDACPEPGAIGALVRRLDMTPGAGIVAGILRYPTGRLQPSAGRFPSLRGSLWMALGLHRLPAARRFEVGLLADARHYRHARRVDWVTAAFCAARAEVGPLPEEGFMYGEDVEWARQATAAGYEVWLEPAAQAVHGVAMSSPLAAVGERQRRRVAFDDRWFAPRGRRAVVAARAIAVIHGGLRWLATPALRAAGRAPATPSREWLELIRAAIRGRH
jgi:GT2 family glycosyltransferase